MARVIIEVIGDGSISIIEKQVGVELIIADTTYNGSEYPTLTSYGDDLKIDKPKARAVKLFIEEAG